MVLKDVVPSHAAMRRFIPLLLASLLLFPAYRVLASPAGDSNEGKELFQAKCSICHTIGQGTKVGPDLKGVMARRDRDWLTSFISTPDKVKPGTAMPSLGLTTTQVNSVIDYLAEQGGAQPAAAPKPAETPAQVSPTQAAAQPTATAGNAGRGKSLFTGSTRFQNGGTPCLACHSIAGVGALGGGTLGPDLTQAFTKFGDSGLTSILTTLPFPIMKPVFGERPLTPQEQTDLKAFLQEAAQAKRSNLSPGILLLIGMGGALVLIALGNIMWRQRRVSGVRRPLVEGKS
ncbi:MAG: c-type cytochrome [Chloroflexi bacterium]|nr:c-type cytochrome [Chloroflexota bacterium]